MQEGVPSGDAKRGYYQGTIEGVMPEEAIVNMFFI